MEASRARGREVGKAASSQVTEDALIPTSANAPGSEGRRRLSVAHLLIALVVMFILSPFADDFPLGKLAESVIFTVVLLSAMNAIGRRHRTLFLAGLLVAPAIATRWIDHFYPGVAPRWLFLLAVVVFVSFVVIHLLHFVMSSRNVTNEVLCAAVSIYLLFAVVWAFAYSLLASYHPHSFTFTVPAEAGSKLSGFTALYFSVQILTALSFGDIIPVSNVARMMTLLQAVCAVFYVTILIARLVALYSRDPPPRDASR